MSDEEMDGSDGGYDEDNDPRPCCSYGALCYRKNDQHIADFKHPGSTNPDHLASNKRVKLVKSSDNNNNNNKKKRDESEDEDGGEDGDEEVDKDDDDDEINQDKPDSDDEFYKDEVVDDGEEDGKKPQPKKIKVDTDETKDDIPKGPSLTTVLGEALIGIHIYAALFKFSLQLEEIMTLLPPRELGNFIRTCKTIYGAFSKASEGSKEDIRLKFLNGIQPIPSALLDVFSLDNEEWVPNKFVSSYEDFKKHFYKRLRAEINTDIDEKEDEKPLSIAGKVLKYLFGKTAPDGSKFVVAGGCVASALLAGEQFDEYDVDIFLIGPKESQTEYACPAADQFFRECFEGLSKDLDELQKDDCSTFVLLKNPNTLSFIIREGDETLPVQFVLRKCSSIAELLFFFDLDGARFAYDGDKVWTTEEGKRALMHGVNFVEHWHENTGVYGARASKYHRRGFPTHFFQAHPLAHKIPHFYAQQAKKFDAKGKNSSGYYAQSKDQPVSGSEYDMNLKDIDNFYDAFNAYLEHNTFGLPPRAFITCEEWLQRDIADLYLARYNEKHLTVTYFVQRCYICGVSRQLFSEKGTKFNRMCPTCRNKNLTKRKQTANLTGRVAIVTGARIKIGFAVALKLLRAGAKVIATTRFSADALERYEKEKDFNKWKDKLFIYPLDLKCGADVLKFVKYVQEHYPRIHILVNNAAQTVRRPILYYKSLIEKEKLKLPEALRDRIALPSSDNNTLFTKKGVFDIANESLVSAKKPKGGAVASTKTSDLQAKALEVLSSNLIEEDFVSEYVPDIAEELKETLIEEYDADSDIGKPQPYFPVGKKDEFGEQLDKRKENSWTTKIDKVHPVEVLEVQAINNIAPTMLISKLMSVMEIPLKYNINNKNGKRQLNWTDGGEIAYIINVTSPEGQFYAHDKTDDHIQNNMSKAALNMLTRSAANYYAKKGIIMVGVDTGWVSSAIPTFVPPPLTTMDGAARILDPIFTKSRKYGHLFRDFEIAPW